MLLQVLCTFHGLRPSAQGSAPSCPLRVPFDDAAGFTRMLRPEGLLRMIFFHAFRRASTHEFLHDLPTSYGAAWPLPRLNFHQLVMPSLARRTTDIGDLIRNIRALFCFIQPNNVILVRYNSCSPKMAQLASLMSVRETGQAHPCPSSRKTPVGDLICLVRNPRPVAEIVMDISDSYSFNSEASHPI